MSTSYAATRIRTLSALALGVLSVLLGATQPRFQPAHAARGLREGFEVRPEIAPSVGFWKRIYGEWTSDQIVFFDRNHPELVYDVLDLRELHRKSRNAVVFEILSKKRIAARTHQLRAALSEWAKSQPKSGLRRSTTVHARSKPLSALAQNIHRAIGLLPEAHRNHPAASFVRGLKIQSGQKDHVLAGLERSLPYLDTMERIFDEFGVPTQVTRLALIESSFNPVATSKVGAAGVWQFMEASSKGKLRVQPQLGIDERRSPIKATRAAAQLLRVHQKILGDWMLTVVSYNHGLRSFMRIPKKRRTADELAHFFLPCNSKSPLGFASRNYYSEFLAFLDVSDQLLKTDPRLKTARKRQRDEVFPPVVFERVQGAASGVQFAKARGLSLSEFKRLNPDVLQPQRPLPSGFWLALPLERPKALRKEARTTPPAINEG